MNMTVHDLNEYMGCRKSIRPEFVKPGMLATQFVGSDRYAMIVVAKPTPKSIVVEHYNAEVHGEKTVDENGTEWANIDSFAERNAQAVAIRLDELNDLLRRYKDTEDEAWITNRIEEVKNDPYFGGLKFTFRKNAGRYFAEGSSSKYTGALHVGVGDDYRDPTF